MPHLRYALLHASATADGWDFLDIQPFYRELGGLHQSAEVTRSGATLSGNVYGPLNPFSTAKRPASVARKAKRSIPVVVPDGAKRPAAFTARAVNSRITASHRFPLLNAIAQRGGGRSCRNLCL